jgi:transposase
MEGIFDSVPVDEVTSRALVPRDEGATPFSQECVRITKQEYIDLTARANYWKAQHARVKAENEALKQEIAVKDAKIKELQNRLFGKKSEKDKPKHSEKGATAGSFTRKRGQQPGSRGHGRTPRPNLPILVEHSDLPDDKKSCPICGLPYERNPALDEQSDVIEVKVKAYTRRINRAAYTRNPGCTCEGTSAILTAPPPPRLIPRSPYGASLWVEVILSKYGYGQPSNRSLQDLSDLGLPLSPGTLAGGLQALAPLFDPILDAWYCKQMSEALFHNDETRWEVFVELPGKVGTRWYLWVTRSPSVVFSCIDPSRSAAVPGAHFAGLQNETVIIVCDRDSAYKTLARLAETIILAYCWAHMRRDFLDAGRAVPTLEEWALAWKAAIGNLYHINQQRLDHWDPRCPLTGQSDAFNQQQEALKRALASMREQATAQLADEEADDLLPRATRARRKKVLTSLLEQWAGLTIFVEHPKVPMDNNPAENSIRTPVNGRTRYYGSGSIWSAELAAMLFSILQTLVLWGINPRHWLTCSLEACAENGAQPPEAIESFLPWSMDEERRATLGRPAYAQTARAPPAEPVGTRLSG